MFIFVDVRKPACLCRFWSAVGIEDGMMPTGGASGLLLFFRDSAFILGKGNNILEIMLPWYG